MITLLANILDRLWRLIFVLTLLKSGPKSMLAFLSVYFSSTYNSLLIKSTQIAHLIIHISERIAMRLVSFLEFQNKLQIHKPCQVFLLSINLQIFFKSALMLGRIFKK
jgi:hypothetical protein